MATQGNRKINRKSYNIEGFAALMHRIIFDDLGGLQQAADETGISVRTMRRTYESDRVSQRLWLELLKQLPAYRHDLEDLCPEGWGRSNRISSTNAFQLNVSRSIASASASLKTGLRLPGNKNYYDIVRKLEGHSRTASYEAKDSNGKRVFIKTLLELPSAATKKVKAVIDELEVRFRREADSHSKLKDVNRIAHVIDNYRLRFNGFPHEIPYLVQEFIDGLTFEQYIAKNRETRIGGVSSDQWFKIARLLLETMRQVHSAGVIHGDICLDNILFKDNEPILVDFGQSFFFDTDFIKESDDNYSRQIEFVAPERRGDGKWSRPADMYSLGGVLLYLACELLPPYEERDNHKLRNYVFSAIQRKNPALLEMNVGIADIILRCLHFSIEDRSSSPGEVLELLSIFEQTPLTASKPVINEIENEVSRVLKQIKRLEQNERRIFLPFLLGDIRLISRRISDVFAGNFLSLVGDREDMILGLLRYLSLLGAGDAYYTLTVPTFWRDDNLGVDGRFIRFNTMLARKGVTIRRVFLLTREELKDPNAEKIIEAQKMAVRSLQSAVNTTDKRVEAGGYYTGYVVVSKAERDKLVLHGHHVGVAKIGDDCLALVFKARDKDGKVRRVELRKEDDPSEVINFFLSRLEKARPITEL